MSAFYVERQYWQRWPRVLLMCKDTGNGVERRRYVPEGGTRDEWNGKVRESVRKLEATRNVLNARINELSDMPNLQAEIDGLQWAVEERDALIRDMASVIDFGGDCFALCKDYTCMEGECRIEAKMREMGIEP